MDAGRSLVAASSLPKQDTSKVMLAPVAFGSEPVYVSAKRYHRILKRRAARNKAKVEMRKALLNPSRSAQAKRRQRRDNGKFAAKADVTSRDN